MQDETDVGIILSLLNRRRTHMSSETPKNIFTQATEFYQLAQEKGYGRLVEITEEGAMRVMDFPITVESPKVSLIIAPDGTVTSGHNAQEVERIFRDVERKLSLQRLRL